ncbi:hypothetical protein BDC45DRAFT_547182 [Circinella umbellata]|nr:hypothetical protein BDC45DRAFT_547182 [Circinella umbellata]
MDMETTFMKLIESIQSIPRTDLIFRREILITMKHIFISHPITRDIFRQSGGYVTLISMIVALEGAFLDSTKLNDHLDHHNDNEKDEKEQDQLLDLLKEIFHVLSTSMRDNNVNKLFFRTHVGYNALENALELTGALDSHGVPRHVFGILFSFAVDEDNDQITNLFASTNKEQDNHPPLIEIDQPEKQRRSESLAQQVESVLKQTTMTVANPEITTSILNLQKSVSSYDLELSDAILYGIQALARSNRRNQVKLNRSGLILAALERLLPFHCDTRVDKNDLISDHVDGDKEEEEEGTKKNMISEREILVQIVKKLITMGISYDELRYIFRGFGVRGSFDNLHKKVGDHLMELILDGVSRSRWPNFIQFDMSTHGYACLEIPSLPNFPPSSPGYTLMAWFYIERMDDHVPLTLLTLVDTSEGHVVSKLLIDPTTRRLQMYQAQVKQTVELNVFEFQPGYWYHIALVHQRAARLGLNINSEDDIVLLYFNLGARYKSLFQDTLRQFQTYEASTTLFLSLRAMTKTFSRRDMDASLLASVMRGAGSTSIQENKFVLALFSCTTLLDGHHTGLTLTGLSHPAQQLIEASTKQAQVILNAAIPKIEAALTSPRSMGYLNGNPVVAYPYGVDESLWRIGGSAVALTLIERSETSEMLLKSVKVLCEMIRYSWRNSEDMERCHGYEILAYLLKQKRELISVELIESLLVFIGKDSIHPEESIINNPFAYRYVILNFEVWKKTPIDVQKAHLNQFTIFLRTSKKRQFNLKRIQKFHLVKRMLLAFRMNIYSTTLTSEVVTALKTVTLSSWNTESIRAIATFLASTVSKGNQKKKENTVVKME